jgi:hypothetical protein
MDQGSQLEDKSSEVYTGDDDEKIIEDIDRRKEFVQLKSPYHSDENEISLVVPYYMLRRELAKGRMLRLKSYQRFGSNFMNPDTPWTRLILNHEMGAGKTVTAIGIALRFIEVYKVLSMADIAKQQHRCVYIIGFTRAIFERDLFRFTELGFITRAEQEYLAKLKHYAQLGAENDIKTYKEFYIKLRRRLGNFKGNGYFRFIGYRELANRVFMGNQMTTNMSEAEIRAGIENNTIGIDMTYISQFKNNLIICDEIHNVYNSLAKNNWGIAIQIILNEFGNNIRALFLSGTLIKNSQTESVDVLNLAVGTKDVQYKRSDFFDSTDQPLPGAIQRIGKLLRGRVSFLVDINPKYFPKAMYFGEPIVVNNVPVKYLKFERCEMQAEQLRAYLSTKDDIATLHEYPYIFDMVFPRPPKKQPILPSKADGLKKVKKTKNTIDESSGGADSVSSETSIDTTSIEETTSDDAPASEAVASEAVASEAVASEAVAKSEIHVATSDIETAEDITGEIPIFKSSGLRTIDLADTSWKAKVGISVQAKEKTITGAILRRENIITYSSKYTRMLDLLEEILASGGGKVFIFHKFIHMTGVFLIGNILGENGFTPVGSPHGANTKCALCGALEDKHSKKEPAHEFTPARYVIIHGELDKRTLNAQLEKYNSSDNTDGGKIMIVIGSRVMKEAYDLIATRYVLVMSRPDNIPSLLQITARAVRAGSHQLLPKDKQTVAIHIFTAKIPDALSYEEDKYVQKINDYIIIQQIEREIHANAVDVNINRKLIEPALKDDGLGHLKFEPAVADSDESAMTTATFDMFYKEREVADIAYIIKRLFMEDSRVWKRDDLWEAVKSPGFEFEYDTKLFSYASFSVAVHRLMWQNDYFGESDVAVEDAQARTSTLAHLSVFDILGNIYDKRILLNGTTIAVIVAIGEYLMAFALDATTKQPIVIADAPYRIPEPEVAQTYNIAPYIRTVLSQQRYLDLKASFAAKFKGRAINEMTDAICMHGHDFHNMLIEEVISYVFNLWTNAKAIASNEYNAFYFQMLYYYDTMGMVIWMNSARDFIRQIYSDFDDIINVNRKSSYESMLPKEYSEKNRGELIHIARSIERSGCSWCPNTTKTRYDASLEKSKLRFAKLKADDLTVTDDVIPIGHIMDQVARFYHPSRDWFASPEYSKYNTSWKENDIIIGFDLRSSGGMHIRFRLRNPKQKIKHHQDARLIERGIICTSRSREYLCALAKKLDVKILKDDANLGNICREIRARLLYLELKERARGSNIKWYFNQFENASIS